MSEVEQDNTAAYEQLAKTLGVKRGRDSVADFRARLVTLAAKEWDVPKAVAKEIVETRWARRVYDNLVRHLGLVRGEKGGREFREFCQSEIGARWGYGGLSMRAFFALTRRPSYDSSPKFYEDLVEFGRAKFDADGNVIPSSLGKGPTPRQFRAVTPPGRDKIKKGAAAKAA